MTQTLEALAITWPEPAVLAALAQVNLLDTWLERRLEQELLLWLQQHQPVAPSLDEQRHAWFGEQAASLFISRRTGLDQVLLSVLQLDDGHLAQELWFRLQTGEADFLDLSHHSIGPERAQGCRIGPIRMAALDPELALVLQRLEPGELAAPLEHGDRNLLLLRLEQRWPARLDAATRGELELELYDNWRLSQVEALLASAPAPGQRLPIPLPTP